MRIDFSRRNTMNATTNQLVFNAIFYAVNTNLEAQNITQNNRKYQVVKVSLGGSLRGNRSVLLGCFLGGFQHPLYEGISRLGYFQLSTLIWLGGIS